MKGQAFALWGLLILGVIALVMVGVSMYGDQDVSQQAIGPGGQVVGSSCADSTGVLTVNARSALATGTDPSGPTITCGVDGGPVTTSVTSGTTTFGVGSALQCLISKADYIDKSFSFDMPCGGKQLDAPLYYSTSDNPAITIKDPDNGDATVTDNIVGGATNLSNPSAGSTFKFDVYFEGTSGEGSGEGIYVIEFPAGSSANITDVTMGNLKKVNIPQVHTLQNAGSKAVAFEVPNIEGAVEPSYRVIGTLSSAKDVSTGVYTDWYAKQEFVDDDDTISSGVEDSDGTAKYENSLDYDFYIAAS